jgi:DNA-binding transcriptional regulator GbsR (MarR family)
VFVILLNIKLINNSENIELAYSLHKFGAKFEIDKDYVKININISNPKLNKEIEKNTKLSKQLSKILYSLSSKSITFS